MLNPTGIGSSPVSFGPQHIGAGLVDRRNWLLSALSNWDQFYGASCKDSVPEDETFSSRLLYHLAHLSLSVSFSDLHLVAGRSGSEEDIHLAEESLSNWMQRERPEKVLDHTIKMLELAHRALSLDAAPSCSFELSVCLFTGGLICWTVCRLQEKLLAEHDGDLHPQQMEGQVQISGLIEHVRQASQALQKMGCWRLSSTFGYILKKFSDRS